MPSEKSVTISIEYTDTTGERRAVTKTITLTSDSSSTIAQNFSVMQNHRGDIFTAFYWPLLALIAIIAVALNKFKFKKNWKLLAALLVVIAIVFFALEQFLSISVITMAAALIISVVVFGWFFIAKAKVIK
jgi:hypothetical protein